MESQVNKSALGWSLVNIPTLEFACWALLRKLKAGQARFAFPIILATGTNVFIFPDISNRTIVTVSIYRKCNLLKYILFWGEHYDMLTHDTFITHIVCFSFFCTVHLMLHMHHLFVCNCTVTSD